MYIVRLITLILYVILIVAECNVNSISSPSFKFNLIILIVAECNVNLFVLTSSKVFDSDFNSSRV